MSGYANSRDTERLLLSWNFCRSVAPLTPTLSRDIAIMAFELRLRGALCGPDLQADFFEGAAAAPQGPAATPSYLDN